MTTRNHHRRTRVEGKTVAIRMIPEVGSHGVNMWPLPAQTGYPIRISSVNSGPQIDGSVTAFRTAEGAWKTQGQEYESCQIGAWGRTFMIGPEQEEMVTLQMLRFNAAFAKNNKTHTPEDQGHR